LIYTSELLRRRAPLEARPRGDEAFVARRSFIADTSRFASIKEGPQILATGMKPACRSACCIGQLPARYVLPSHKDFYAAQLKVLRRLAAPEGGRSLLARDKFRAVATAYDQAAAES
jgi:hypothetical protein